MKEQESSRIPLQIDIRDVIRKKNPRLLKSLPGFVLRYIERIIHQEENNHYLKKYKDCNGHQFNEAILKEWNIRIEVRHEHHIPEEGRFIFAANHPIGGIESLAFMKIISKYHPRFRFPVNDILMHLTPYREIFIPINKHGGYTKEAARLLEETYMSDEQVLYFPAGLVSRKRGKKIIDVEWKKSFITKAIQHRRDVVPVHILGRNSDFFYNLSILRRMIGIKANIEMFYLVNEMYKQKNKTLVFTIGEPIPYTAFDKSKSDHEWAQYVREIVYGLNPAGRYNSPKPPFSTAKGKPHPPYYTSAQDLSGKGCTDLRQV
ncbi:MAG: glycerol acyltransferase [Bacteroidetes bacterium]|nr:glycerol acyltransferase [Bacteroidota bacterium]